MSDLILPTDDGPVRGRLLANNAMRVSHAPPGATAFPPERPWFREVILPLPPPDPGRPSLTLTARDGSLQVRSPDGAVVVTELSGTGYTDGGARLVLQIAGGEGFYGGGQWFNAFHRDSGRVTLETKESQSFNQWRQTYSNIPLFISSRGYAILLLNSYRSTWRIDRRRGVLEIAADGPPLDYVVIHGPTPRAILETYTALTGRPPLLPRWAFGLWVTGYPQERQDVVLERAEAHRLRGIPLDGIILDYHWEQGFHTFRWRRSLFPDPDAMIARLRSLGVRLGLIFTPFVNRRNHPIQRRLLHLLFRNVAAGEMRADERALDLYREAKQRGYLAHDNAWWWLGSGGMIDFTNAAAARWWNDLLRPLYEQGIALFKNDDGEYLPADARSALGMDGREYHNIYGFFYGRAIYEGMKELDDRRPMIYARSVWAGSQRYPALFMGDQKPRFRHIRSTLRAGLNMGLLGFAYWTADVFGLDGKTTPETHMRYAQWALMAPVARYFWRPPAIDNTRLPWSHGPEAERNFREYALLRYRLLPYYHNLGWEAYRAGLPLMRPMLLEFPGDPRFAKVADQVMLGGALLLAPVTKAGAKRRRVLLPPGPWHDFWSTQSWQAGAVSYATPPDRLPLLVRGGSILPLGPALESIPEDHRFDRLELHCYPPYPAALLFHDDDGRTRAYERGGFSTTRISAEGDARRVTVRIAAAEGGFDGQAEARAVEVVLHRVQAAPARVRVNGEETGAARYDSAGQRVSVPVTAPVDRETMVEVEWGVSG